MRSHLIFMFFTALFFSSYAYAQIPSCPCDTAELENGVSGDEIVDILCPGGNLGEGVESVVNRSEVTVRRSGVGGLGYFVSEGGVDDNICILSQDTIPVLFVTISDEEYEDCRERLIQGCNLPLQRVSPIPTLSEWGMIAMAGVLGVIGLYAASRRRKAAA